MIRRYGRVTGFTLIETLIAVTIFSIVAVVLYSIFRSGVISWRRIDKELESQQDIRYALDRLTADLKNMVLISNLPFKGGFDMLRLTTFRSISKTAGPSLVVVDYYLDFDKDDSTRTLIRRETSLKDALAMEYAQSLSDEEDNGDSYKVSAEGLLHEVRSFKISYLQPGSFAPEDMQTDADESYEWVDVWEKEDALPRGAKLELKLGGQLQGHDITISKRIYIPAGKADAQIDNQRQQEE